MRRPPDQPVIRALFASGVEAVLEYGASLDSSGWEAQACGSWTATETVRHVLAVSRWYHAWLDRALGGDLTPPFDAASMDQRNEAELTGLAGLGGGAALAEFAESAMSYLDRLSDNWDVPYAYPYGVVTAGLHAGLAATEWHLHAWDLSTVGGQIHSPVDPKGLFLAAGGGVAAAEGGVKGEALSWIVPIMANRSPWRTLLERSGRIPVG